MSRLGDNPHWLLFAGVVLTTLGAVGVAAVGFVATLATLVGGGSLLTTVATFLLGTLLLVGLDIVFAVALLRTLAKMASFPTSDRAAAVCHRLGVVVPPLSRLGDRFEPSVEDRQSALADRYVSGELSERELEAELQRLLDDEEGAESVTEPVATADREVETET